MSGEHQPVLQWRPIDDAARHGDSLLVKADAVMALVRWNGDAWVYPASGDRPIDFTPEAYYDPSWRQAGASCRG